MPKRLEGLIFDMGDILYDASQWRRWLTSELVLRGVDVAYEDVVVQWEALLADVYRGKADYWDRFDQLLEQFGFDLGARHEIRHLAERQALEVQKDRVPMEGVPETLAKLQEQRVKLAVLSDNESGEEKIRAVLDELGIEQYFSAVVSSADIGEAKPSPGAFKAALDAIELGREVCGFVGHDYDELDGAASYGLYTIAFNCDREMEADVWVESFRLILDVAVSPSSE